MEIIGEELGAGRAAEIAAFQMGRTPLANREYSPFLDAGRARLRRGGMIRASLRRRSP